MLPIPPDHTLLLSFLDARAAAALDAERDIVKARNYHNGRQQVFLADRLRQFLSLTADSDATFNMNVCRVVVEALAERLAVKGWECADEKQQAWAEAVWAAARMDVVADDVHEQGLRDGESFLIVDWDTEAKAPKFFSHPRYTSVDAGGNGDGCIMVYPYNDVSQPALFAVKRWTEYIGVRSEVARQRATFYFPDRIEKRYFTGSEWLPIKDDEAEPWPIPWLAADGRPRGIAVIHFKNKGMRPEAQDEIPLQDVTNKTLVDLVASADLTAFRIYVAMGFVPTTDGAAYNGSNALVLEPGTIVGATATSGQADFKAIDGADLRPMLDMLGKTVQWGAMVTSTPGHRFQISGLSPAEGTLKQQDMPLLAKARSRQILFGSAWVDAMNMARRLANSLGGAGLNETEVFKVVWEETDIRSDAEKQAEWKVKKELGIPRRQLWSEMGYTADQIEKMMADPEVALGSFASYPGIPTGADTLAGAQQGDPLGGADTVTGGAAA
jgi:hypothetical protein